MITILQEVMENISSNVDNYFITCLFKRDTKHLNSTYYGSYEKLDELGRIFNTDKSSIGHNYLNKYEHYFEKYKNKFSLL